MKANDRVAKDGRFGTVLRMERYPGQPGIWATVKWDDRLSARRESPPDLAVVT